MEKKMEALQHAFQPDLFTPLFAVKCLIVAGLICYASFD